MREKEEKGHMEETGRKSTRGFLPVSSVCPLERLRSFYLKMYRHTWEVKAASAVFDGVWLIVWLLDTNTFVYQCGCTLIEVLWWRVFIHGVCTISREIEISILVIMTVMMVVIGSLVFPYDSHMDISSAHTATTYLRTHRHSYASRQQQQQAFLHGATQRIC